MTVKELKQQLDKFDDNKEVNMCVYDWYRNTYNYYDTLKVVYTWDEGHVLIIDA